MRISFGNPDKKIEGQWQFRLYLFGYEFIFTLINCKKVTESFKKLGIK